MTSRRPTGHQGRTDHREAVLARVVSSASLDGFIAFRDDTVGPLFDWYQAGDVEVPTAMAGLTFSMTPTSAEYWRTWTEQLGALVVGRRLFDLTGGWGGTHPLGVPVVVLTDTPPADWAHPEAPFEFVGDVGAAVARAGEIAGDRTVGVAAGTVAGQCLEAGMLDAVAIDLVPVVLGEGRPYFGAGAARLGDPTTVVQGERVTHLVFPTLR